MNQPELYCDERFLALLRTERTEQKRQFDRVASRIESAVLDFMAIHHGEQFYAVDLWVYVNRVCGPVAPDSPRRILHGLQERGLAHYKVINRAKSLYFAGRQT